MIVDDTFLVVDRRLGQSIRRWWWGDNRHAVVSFLQRMVDDVAYFVQSPKPIITPEMQSRVVHLLPRFKAALTRVKSAYADDTITSFKLDNVIDEVETIIQGLSSSG